METASTPSSTTGRPTPFAFGFMNVYVGGIIGEHADDAVDDGVFEGAGADEDAEDREDE